MVVGAQKAGRSRVAVPSVGTLSPLSPLVFVSGFLLVVGSLFS